MNTENRFQEIIDKLREFKKSVETGFTNLVSELKTQEIQQKIEHFKEVEISKVSSKVLQAIEVIDAPIYVGLLGRYSHGKTALLNEFFSIGEEYSLPEGEGVVTSKITLIAFDSQVSSPRCLQKLRNKTEHLIPISIETLKASVREKVVDVNTEITDYYEIKLPTKEPFSKLFEEEKIHVIDMPGLGSPYEKDTHKVLRIMDHIDLLIVVVKITEIDERAGNAIDGYIRDNLSIPIIPVLTFFDKWKECDAFVACVDEEELVIKAKQLIEDKIPSLSKYLLRAIAVSSKTRFNIAELRQCVLNFVKEQDIGISKAKREVPEITKRKFSEVSRELNRLAVDTENSLNRLQKEIKSLLPKSQNTQSGFESFEETFKRQKDRFITEAERKISRSVRDIFSDFRAIIQDIRFLTNYNEVRERINSIEQEINSKKYPELKKDIDNLVQDFKGILSDAVINYIDNLDIDELSRKDLKQSALSAIERYSLEGLDNPYEAQSIVADILENLMKSAIDFFLDNLTNPQFILPLILPFVAIPITLALSSLPWNLGKGLATGLTSLVNLLIIILPIVFVWRVVASDRTKRFNEAKNKIIDKLIANFDKHKQKVLNDSCQSFAKGANEIVKDVEQELEPVTDDYSKDVQNIAKRVQDFQSRVIEINKFLQKQIQIIESEQF